MAVLLAVEVFIAAAIVWSVSGHGISVRAAGLHRFDRAGHIFGPVEAGTAPHVVVDDSGSRVVLSPSGDGKIHVTDVTGSGWFWGRRPALQVTRTPDGVSIQRPAGGSGGLSFMSFYRQRVEIAVPPASAIDVRRCAGADVSGLTGQVRAHSTDGSIAVSDLRVSALTLSSEDGRLRLDDVAAPSIDAFTQDGSIHAQRLAVGGGSLSTQDGSVSLNLRAADVTVHAKTQDGSIDFNGRHVDSSDDASGAQFQVGRGGPPLAVTTQDGSIHIDTNGV